MLGFCQPWSRCNQTNSEIEVSVFSYKRTVRESLYPAVCVLSLRYTQLWRYAAAKMNFGPVPHQLKQTLGAD